MTHPAPRPRPAAQAAEILWRIEKDAAFAAPLLANAAIAAPQGAPSTSVPGSPVAGGTLRRGASGSDARDAEPGHSGMRQSGSAASASVEGASADQGRARLTQLVYGTLRMQVALDALLVPHCRKNLSAMDGLCRNALRVTLYEIVCMAAPPHAAVGACVAYLKAKRSRPLGGLANAVLRAVLREPPTLSEHVALPAWIEARLTASLGQERVHALSYAPMPPKTGIACADAAAADALREALRAEAEVAVSPFHPLVLNVRRAGSLDRLAPIQRHQAWVQEEGSQLIAECLPLGQGASVLDACAGRGHKTLALLRRDASLKVSAADCYPEKLELLLQACARHFPETSVETAATDWTRGSGDLAGRTFDLVLVDAPCSGLGTAARRPELLHRLTPERLAELQAGQQALLAALAAHVAPGGTLAYCVCSPLREEGAHIAEAFAAQHPQFALRPLPVPAALAPAVNAAGPFLELGPWLDPAHDGPDAYFLALWTRSSGEGPA